MMNSPGLLDHAKEEVVILRAIELGTEAAGLLHDIATHCGQMANVVVGKEKIGRPIRFKQRCLKAIFAKFVFIGINQIGIRMGLQEFHNLKKRIGFDDIIMIEKSNPFPMGKRESLIRGRRNASMFSETFQDNTPITSGQHGQRSEQIGVARSIVD